MDEEEWRTTVTLANAEDASSIYKQLGDSQGLAATGCSLSSDGGNVFVYGASRDQVDGAAAVIASSLTELGLSATAVTTDKWLADEARWGDPNGPSPEEGDDSENPKQGWLSTFMDGLSGGGPM